MVTAWPSSMPSAVVSLTILLLRCGSSASLISPSLQSCPGLAAVGAAHHAVDLERGVDLVRLLRVLGETHHAGGERTLAVAGDDGRRQLAPARRRRRRCDRRRSARRRQDLLGSRLSTMKDQTCFLASGKLVRLKVAPRSVLRHTPSLVPANTVSGSSGCTNTV